MTLLVIVHSEGWPPQHNETKRGEARLPSHLFRSNTYERTFLGGSGAKVQKILNHLTFNGFFSVTYWCCSRVQPRHCPRIATFCHTYGDALRLQYVSICEACVLHTAIRAMDELAEVIGFTMWKSHVKSFYGILSWRTKLEVVRFMTFLTEDFQKRKRHMLQLSFNSIEQLIIFNNPWLFLVVMKIMPTFAVKKEDANN